MGKQTTLAVNGPLWGERAREWADLQEHVQSPAFEAVLSRVGAGPGVRHLDLGCGAGLAVQLSAGRGATVSGIDASKALLEIARERTPNADLRLTDLEALPFADGAFDLVTSFNAVQYAGSPVDALREAGRVTRPGGLIAVLVWGEPEGMEAARLITAVRPLLPPPPPGTAGPFALSGGDVLRRLLEDAGLTPGDLLDVDIPFHYPDVATAVRAWDATGPAARARALAGDAAVSRAHAEALAPFARDDGSVVIQARFRCLFAHV